MWTVQDQKDGRTLYQCPDCGTELWSAYPPNRVHHQCGTPKRHDPREQLEQQLDSLLQAGANGRSREAIWRTLDRCFDGCDRLVDGVCVHRGGTCSHRRRWVEALLLKGCERAGDF